MHLIIKLLYLTNIHKIIRAVFENNHITTKSLYQFAKKSYTFVLEMKQTKVIILTAVTSVVAFFAVMYTSCSKDKCKGVSCQNGATSCIGGTCQCPTGYYGNYCELSAIVIRNNTFTTLYVTVSGSSATVPVDSCLSFIGQSGSSASIYALTYGGTATNPRVGDSVTWSKAVTFPTGGGTDTEKVEINQNYFYLKMKNTDASQSVVAVYVNYMITGAQTIDSVTIPHDGNVYGIGYYVTYPLTEVYVVFNNGNNWSVSPAINDTITNSTVTVTVP